MLQFSGRHVSTRISGMRFNFGFAVAFELGLDSAGLDDAEVNYATCRQLTSLNAQGLPKIGKECLLFQFGCISLATDSVNPSTANLLAW